VVFDYFTMALFLLPSMAADARPFESTIIGMLIVVGLNAVIIVDSLNLKLRWRRLRGMIIGHQNYWRMCRGTSCRVKSCEHVLFMDIVDYYNFKGFHQSFVVVMMVLHHLMTWRTGCLAQASWLETSRPAQNWDSCELGDYGPRWLIHL